MWFRKSETPETEIVVADSSEKNNNNNNNNQHTNNSTPHEPSKFERFRRASFRRKSSHSGNAVVVAAAATAAAPRRRSKSPHHILRSAERGGGGGSSLEEAAEEEDEEEEELKLNEEKKKVDEVTTKEKSKLDEVKKKLVEEKTRNEKPKLINLKTKVNVKPLKENEEDDDDDDDDDLDTSDDDDDDDDNDDDDDVDDYNDDDNDNGGNPSQTRLANSQNPISINDKSKKSLLISSELYRAEVSIPLSSDLKATPHLLPISDPPAKPSSSSSSSKSTFGKKSTLKSLKTDPPKRKFYKNFTSAARRQNSRDSDKVMANDDVINSITNNNINNNNNKIDEDDDALPANGKEKILLTDPKFRNNRIQKSSSKTKISSGDLLEKRESIKRSRSGRKISAPPSLGGGTAAAAASTMMSMMQKTTTTTADDKNNKSKKNKKSNDPKSDGSRTRSHSNLNLQALVKFVVSNKKFLNTEDFALIRRKSISEAASSIIAVAATCKPLPIALKYSQDGVVAEAPKDNDPKAAKNVVLVKKQNLKNSFCDRLNNNNNNSVNKNKDEIHLRPKVSSTSSEGGINNKNNNKVKRNSSNSSKSSGNFEDEAFYSCDEQDQEKTRSGGEMTTTTTPDALQEEVTTTTSTSTSTTTTTAVAKRKSSSPSLTSRVAAKINETTNNYKNRKAAAAANKSAAKKRKSLATGKRPEYYKQISVERLHSTSIVRQPSDRRPDAAAANNTSIRSNGNTSHPHNSSDHTQSQSQQDASNAAGVAASAAAAGDAGGVGGAATIGSDASAQDAAVDARRDRLQQQHQQNKSAPVSVNRSESYKERLTHKRNRNSRRKTSDPSLTSRPNDDQPDLGLSNSNYTASSNSSLSSGGGSESPSTSMEQVAGGAAVGSSASSAHHQHQHHHHPHHSHAHAHPHHQTGAASAHPHHGHSDSFHGSSGSGSNANNTSFWGGSIGGSSGPTISQLSRQWPFESDDEDDLLIEADWSSNVAADILAALTDAEKKRQEIINEIYQTERNHVRTLKLLERLFFCPLQESGVLSYDHLLLLFPPALLSLRELHGSFEQQLKQRRIEHSHVVSHVGDLLAGMFDGQSGEELREHAAQFCARQQIALEALKEKRRKDEQLQKFLSKAESHKACRRLQLKDLLPTVLQRLTKYPLLFENLYKVTIRVVPENLSEAEAIQRALESSKKILVDVNQAVKTAEDAHKLQNIQRKLDKSTFDKDEFKNLDLTQYRLIHDGSLTMKKNPGIQLHGLLFENMIVLLTKQDDKYSLKYLNATRISEVNKQPLSPIMNIDSETLVRQEAADKNSFFLIKTKTSQMLELRAPSSSECKTWFKHISDAAEQYKPRSKNSSHESSAVDDPAIATLPHSNTKESLELTPERPPPASATATMTTTPLAPMMMLPNNNHHHPHHPHQLQQQQQQHHHNNHSVDLRSPADGLPSSAIGMGSGSSSSSSSLAKNRMNNNELSINRTMSTRSCGETNNNYGPNGEKSHHPHLTHASSNGVTLRHTQSARQANNNSGLASSGSGVVDDGALSIAGGGGSGSKRDSTSIIYSNNSNNTRTLMQSSPPLVEPTAIQISISPAHTAEPVLTPAEKLRRLDASIRDGLLEKQQIICDMFRLPIEHFHEIVDIASLPEAPKDSADIALAAYAQVQSLTEVVNEYMKVTPEQEISAVSTSVCDQCHEKQRSKLLQTRGGASSTTTTHHHHQHRPISPLVPTTSSSSSTTTATQRTRSPSPSPPPLPPPNKQQAQGQHKTATPPAKLLTHSLDADQMIHEDDDGYCEIDELRLPALPPLGSSSSKPVTSTTSSSSSSTSTSTTNNNNSNAPPPLPPPAGSFKTPPLPPPPSAAVVAAAANSNNGGEQRNTSPELTKRQSTISADSIPEESADEVTQAMDDSISTTAPVTNNNDGGAKAKEESESKTELKQEEVTKEEKKDEDSKEEEEKDSKIEDKKEGKKETKKESKKESRKDKKEDKNDDNKEVKKEDKSEVKNKDKSKDVPEQDKKNDDVDDVVKANNDGDDNKVQDDEADDDDKQAEKKSTKNQKKDEIVEKKTEVAAGGEDSTATATTTTSDDGGDQADHHGEENQKEVASTTDTNASVKDKETSTADAPTPTTTTTTTEPQRQNSAATTAADEESLNSSEHIEINDAYDTLATLNKLNTALSMVDNTSQTILTGTGTGTVVGTTTTATTTHCGPNRILHASSLEPSVPCYALNSIVTALNAQISLLLPKINERDMERERLRKENQHLRELLNAMHDRQRVEATLETPKDITTSADADDEIDASTITTTTTNNNNNNNSTASSSTTEAPTASTAEN